MAEQHCALFGGASGKLVVLTLTGGAFLSWTGIFAYRKAAKQDPRSWKVFWLDLSKMGFGQALAYGVNVLNAHRNAQDFDAVSWYLPTFLNDETIAVPLGVLLWHRVVLPSARALSRRRPMIVWLQALKASGRYYPERIESEAQGLMLDPPPPACGLAPATASRGCGRCLDRAFCCEGQELEVRYDWWLTQLICWVCCVVASRLLGGLVIPAVAAIAGAHSPYYLLAGWIYGLPWSCAEKQWTFAGVMRIAIDVLQLAVVDYFNKFHRRSAHDGGGLAAAGIA